MLNTVVRLMIVSMLMIVAAPAYSGSAMQIFHCEQDDDATDEDIDKIASEWLKAAKGMKGGEQLEAYLRYPIAAGAGEHDFTFVLIAPSFEEWGVFTDGYEGSPAQDVDEKWNELADCLDSTVWESQKVE